MNGFFVVFGIVFLLFLLVIVLPYYIGVREAENEMKRNMLNGLKKSKESVRKYATKFNASMSHLQDIDAAIHELVKSNKLEFLKPLEAYGIPMRYHFNAQFHILITENLDYRVIICPTTIAFDNTEKVKRYLPHSMTVEEFDSFVEECKKDNYNAGVEKFRRGQVSKVLNNAIK